MNPADGMIALARRAGFSLRTVVLCLADLLALLGPISLIFALRAAFGDVSPTLYLWVFSLLLLGPFLGAGFGLYQTVSLPRPQEVKALFLLGTLLYGIILVALFLSQTGKIYSRLIIAGGWLGTIFALPILRAAARRLFAKKAWWGRPLLILDRSDTGRDLWHYLKRHPENGLTPVNIFSLPDDIATARETLTAAAARYPHAVVLLPHVAARTPAAEIVKEAGRWFSDIVVAPAFCGGQDMHWLTICDLGLTPALWIRQNLSDRRRLFIKRCIDVTFCLLALPVLLPLGLVLAGAIRLDSPGPALYRHKRIGRDGREIRIYKFRTMVINADATFKNCLEKDAALRKEWENFHKIRNDPRVTRVGAFLRKTSLDELPQFINVLAGAMSLVGPRPIVAAEIKKYGPVYAEYCRVRPGITGLWQISGRNNTSYGDRVAYDHYYICNWSVWMDVWILVRTVPVALSGYGAY
ncbi:MAG: undecaprenyl-phosphate galactose phosphotransferase WbaP [Desulfovibrio sp.]|jgi:Undecaprenyl-phosphate galactose phosphotransferase WbaP|nr:undecaprenyl-phosphate galactose phosphotransferase WbaP [Desulfovibrio sp.]